MFALGATIIIKHCLVNRHVRAERPSFSSGGAGARDKQDVESELVTRGSCSSLCTQDGWWCMFTGLYIHRYKRTQQHIGVLQGDNLRRPLRNKGLDHRRKRHRCSSWNESNCGRFGESCAIDSATFERVCVSSHVVIKDTPWIVLGFWCVDDRLKGRIDFCSFSERNSLMRRQLFSEHLTLCNVQRRSVSAGYSFASRARSSLFPHFRGEV